MGRRIDREALGQRVREEWVNWARERDAAGVPTPARHLAPLKRLRPLWREMREPLVRLRKRGGETRADGTLVENQHRMGPLTLEARAGALAVVLAIQSEINAAADAAGRPRVDLLNAEEEARILELIALRTFPQRWNGDEPLATDPFDEPSDDASAQPSLFGEEWS